MKIAQIDKRSLIYYTLIIEKVNNHMANFILNINGEQKKVDVDPNTPLLWVLREDLDLVGTKYGCGMSQCGACTVHLMAQLLDPVFYQFQQL